MASFSGLSIATSGLRAAQAGIYVTGHNTSNVNTLGYSRQRTTQGDFLYRNLGVSRAGRLLQSGLGTDVENIRQVRNKFLDITYRNENSKGNYYGVATAGSSEIERILAELNDEDRGQTAIIDMKNALHNLKTNPRGIETRQTFIDTCIKFLDKANNVNDRLIGEQYRLDGQIKQGVQRINQLMTTIAEYNQKIPEVEHSGDYANDYRDARNNALDELSEYLDITYKEPGDGTVSVMLGQYDLIKGQYVNQVGLRYLKGDTGFIEPVFTNSTDILKAIDIAPVSLFKIEEEISTQQGNDRGALKAMFMTRGNEIAYYFDTSVTGITAAVGTIPKAQQQWDTLVHGLVTMINDAVAPQIQIIPPSPVGLDGSAYNEVFVRKDISRYNAGVYNVENSAGKAHKYTTSNIEINPLFLDPVNVGKLALSISGDLEDQTLILSMLDNWESPLAQMNPNSSIKSSITEAYNILIDRVAAETSEYGSFLQAQTELITTIDGKRQMTSAVSMDEEMSKMLTYQHAYNASARMVNVIDSMIDKVVNEMGR